MKSFFRYVQAQAPEQIVQAQQVLDIKTTQAPEPGVDYLPEEAIGLLLGQAKRRGSLDLALLTTFTTQRPGPKKSATYHVETYTWINRPV